ncbi:hypothetical protein MtrunA17_Chr3g0138301 [Medicago truncatula]|uniref:Uncharacterized protein n=1 Tax=Medicago truncatula TaxID=3880 RepID=A0A396J1U0_MEDTR|nr:hypothetical protein MtrunA17_Chr3g0138301 [Medicago truncatula]
MSYCLSYEQRFFTRIPPSLSVSPALPPRAAQLLRKPNPPRIQKIPQRFAISVNRVAAPILTEEKRTTTDAKREEERSTVVIEKRWDEKKEKERRSGRREYLEQAKKELIGAADGGPPRWLSPLECGSRLEEEEK